MQNEQKEAHIKIQLTALQALGLPVDYMMADKTNFV
jgi:hypothetical protein